jgi:hypothetical protein
VHAPISFIRQRRVSHGKNQADRKEVHWWEGTPQTIGNQHSQKVCTYNWSSQGDPEEASPLSSGDCGSQGDSQVSEVHRTSDPQAAILAVVQGGKFHLSLT